jgi:hypothetical protein
MRLGSLATSGTNRPIAPAPIDNVPLMKNVEQLMKLELAGGIEGNTRKSAHISLVTDLISQSGLNISAII